MGKNAKRKKYIKNAHSENDEKQKRVHGLAISNLHVTTLKDTKCSRELMMMMRMMNSYDHQQFNHHSFDHWQLWPAWLSVKTQASKTYGCSTHMKIMCRLKFGNNSPFFSAIFEIWVQFWDKITSFFALKFLPHCKRIEMILLSLHNGYSWNFKILDYLRRVYPIFTQLPTISRGIENFFISISD